MSGTRKHESSRGPSPLPPGKPAIPPPKPAISPPVGSLKAGVNVPAAPAKPASASTSVHKASAESETCKFSIFTISDTRTIQDDESGKVAIEVLTKFGHSPVDHRIIKNERRLIEAAITGAVAGEAELVVTVGGTGISKKDLTIEAIRPILWKEMPGFGELFRANSAKEIGTAAIMSRALLGVTEKLKLVCALPGSPDGVRLALAGILAYELKHILWELRRYK